MEVTMLVVAANLFVGEDDAAGGLDVLVDGAGVNPQPIQTSRSWPEISILHFLYVIAGLAERRNSVGTINRAFAGIVRRQSQIQVPIIPLQQGLKVANTCV